VIFLINIFLLLPWTSVVKKKKQARRPNEILTTDAFIFYKTQLKSLIDTIYIYIVPIDSDIR